MILRALIGIAQIADIGTRISPEKAGLYCSTVGLHVVLGTIRHHHAVDQHARHLHLARIERAALGDALDLHDDDTAGVARGHGDRARLQGQRLLLHGDVAVGVGSGAADDADVDRKGLVEQVVLAVDRHQPHKILGGARVELATAEARIDEGAQPDPGQRARLAGGDVAEQVRDHPLRQVPGLDAVIDRKRLQARHQPPVAADHARHQALVAEVVEAARLAVALPGRIHQGQVARAARAALRLEEALFERDRDALGKADADEAAGGDRVAAADQAHRLARRNDLAGV
jgi:hypothetical protein